MSHPTNDDQKAHYLSWVSGIEQLGLIKLKLLSLSLVAMATPMLLLSFWQSRQSLEMARNFRSGGVIELTLLQYAELFIEFLSGYSLIWLLSACVIGCGYFSLVKLTANTFGGNEAAQSLSNIWLGQLRTLMPRGIVTFLLLVFCLLILTNLSVRLGGAGVFIQVILIFLMGLSYAIPIRLCLYRDGPISAIKNSFSINYANKSKLSKWVIVYQMFTLQFCAAILLYGISQIKSIVLQIDKWLNIPRTLILSHDDGLNQHWFYWISEALYLGLSSLIISAFAVLSTIFYLKIRHEVQTYA